MSSPSPNPLIIGCGAVINEFKHLLPESRAVFKSIDAGLHLRPEQLKLTLQQAIDEADGKQETVILGFGLCSMAVIGLHAQHSTLVVPRVDDCIAMFIGSQAKYKEVMRQEPGTYFLSRGWIDAQITLVDERRGLVERYGEKRAATLMKKMLGNYKRLAYIEVSGSDQDAYREFSRRAAAQMELEYHEIKGTTALLDAMLAGDWNEAFIVVRPGRAICLDDFKPVSSSLN